MLEKVKIFLAEKVIEGRKGQTLLEALSLNNITINSYCGGKGTCGKCKIMVESPFLPTSEEKKLLSEKELEKGARLACKTILKEDMHINISDNSWLNQPKMVNEKIQVKLNKIKQNASSENYGLALDIGTTSVEGWLVHLDKGDVVATHTTLNPQQPFGADVVSRIQSASNEEGLAILHQKIINGINDMILKLTEQEKISYKKIEKATVVGNPTMLHLFLGIPPDSIGRAPYEPKFYDAQYRLGEDLDLKISPKGQVITLPIIAGYLGGDIMGVALALDLDEREENILVVDIGTNSEILLASKGRIIACSAAAGPAFEGAHIHHGMRASAGAIEKVKIDGKVNYLTINGNKPLGICGSGLIDAVVELLKIEILEETGRIQMPPESNPLYKHFNKANKSIQFILNPDDEEHDLIWLEQKDIREIQLAKGATYAGIEILKQAFNMHNHQIDQVYLAGSFGRYINIENAMHLGIIPKVPIAKVQAIGNAAIKGGALALLSEEYFNKSIKLKKEISHIELVHDPKFNDLFMDGISFDV